MRLGVTGQRPDASGQKPEPERWISDIRAAIVVAIIAGLGSANAVLNSFTLDDDTIIGKNALLWHLSGLWRAFAHPYWPQDTPGGQYRPLAIASFVADWAVSGGSAHWMHAMNVAWHVLACVLVWRLLRDLVSPTGALAGALYFALQPVHVEAIANTVGRCDLMAGAFVVAAVLAHRRDSWLAVPLYAAALASKESGAVFLGLALANDLIVGANSRALDGAVTGTGTGTGTRASVGGVALVRRRRRLYAAYFGVAAVYAATLAVVFRHRPLVDIAPAWFHATWIDRWLTEARVVPEYLRLMVVPFELKIEYSPRVIDVAHGLSVFVAAGLAMAAVAGVCLALTWRRAPVVALGLAWFAIAISPVSNLLFASGVVLAERTLYLPSVGAALVTAWGAAAVWAHLANGATTGRGRGGGASIARMRWIAGGAGIVMSCAFAVRSWTRTSLWHDDKRLVLASLLGEPESYRTHLRAAIILGYRKDWVGAERQYAVARTLYPDDPYVYEAAAMVADGQDHYADAERLYDSANLVTPGLFDVNVRQARLRFRSGDFAGAIRSARTAYLIDRDSVAALNVLTGAAQRIGDFASAEWAFRRGLADHPGLASLHQQYAWMLAARGDTAASRREAALVARLTPPPSGGAAVSAAVAADGMSR